VAGQLDQGRRAELGAGAVRDVVEHDRQRGGIGHGQAVRDDAGLRGPGVVRRDQEQRVGPRVFGLAGLADAVRGVVAAHPGDHRGPASCAPRDRRDQLGGLRWRQGRRLARGAGDDEPVAAGGQQVVDQPGDRVLAHAAVGAHRRDHGDQAGAELGGVAAASGVVVMSGCHGPILGASQRCGPAMLFREYCVAWLHD
jgi:hypothetical protein